MQRINQKQQIEKIWESCYIHRKPSYKHINMIYYDIWYDNRMIYKISSQELNSTSSTLVQQKIADIMISKQWITREKTCQLFSN